jgi:tRNA-modifying protein YgfZ
MDGMCLVRITCKQQIKVNNVTMSNHWQTELTAQGAYIDKGAVQHFGDAQRELNATAHTTILCDLSHLGLIELNGADALSFLQGQLTNDIKLLNAHNAQWTGYCSAKGRLLAIFLAYTHQSSIYLQLPCEIHDAMMKRLKMFVLRSKVNVVASDIVGFGISGPEATTRLSAISPELPSKPLDMVHHNDYSIIKLPSHQFDRYVIHVNSSKAGAIWSQLLMHCQPVGKPCWDWLEIQAGIPEIVMATQEQFVPQMANLDLLGGINFKKGCYTGQEIVARTHYLGSVKRRTYLAHLASMQTPLAGDKVYTADQQEVGQIIRATPAPEGGAAVLAELRIEAKEAGKVFWQTHMLDFKPLPYSLNTGD